MTRGKISPPSGIFLMKNWLNYKDTISFENTVDTGGQNNTLMSQEDIQKIIADIETAESGQTTAELIAQLPDE